MSIEIRAGLKKLIPAVLWPFFRAIDKYVIDGLYIYFAIRHFWARGTVRHIHPLSQSISRVDSQIHLGAVTAPDNLVQRFKKEQFDFQSGRHSVYIFRLEEIARINPVLLQRYPHPFGLKIIKSREMSADSSTPYYTSRKLAPASSWFSMLAVGSVKEKIVISNLLYGEKVAPRVYDLLKLESADGGWQYALVVQHVAGPVVTGQEGMRFIARFRAALDKFGLQTISIKEHCDLRPPDFRHNIVRGRHHACYVDIQNFVMFRRAFLREVFLKADHFKALDTAPAILDTLMEASQKQQRDLDLFQRNCSLLHRFFEQHGLALEHRVLVDMSNGCGLFAMCCLHLGARWCIMVREERIARWLYLFLTLLGFSRFQIVSSTDDIVRCPDDILQQRAEVVFIRAKDLLIMGDDPFLSTYCDVIIVETESSAINDIPGLFEQLPESLVPAGFFQFSDPGETVLCWHLFRRIN